MLIATAQTLDTLFVAFVILISKDTSSLNELAVKAPAKPDSKGKGKGHSGNFVDILFSILNAVSSEGCDPLALVAPGSVHTDAELRVAGIGKKEKLTVRLAQHILRTNCLMSLVTGGHDTFDDQE